MEKNKERALRHSKKHWLRGTKQKKKAVLVEIRGGTSEKNVKTHSGVFRIKRTGRESGFLKLKKKKEKKKKKKKKHSSGTSEESVPKSEGQYMERCLAAYWVVVQFEFHGKPKVRLVLGLKHVLCGNCKGCFRSLGDR